MLPPTPDPASGEDRRGRAATAAGCVILLTLFAALSWTAARGKCPTFDEPQNTVGAWMILHEGDWRVHPDHPALWQYWAALPNGPQALHPDRGSPEWDQMLHSPWSRVLWTAEMLFRTPGVDGERVVARSRAMMLCLAVTLGCLIALWARQLAGPFASIVAVAFFTLDPNFLAHASLVKNDVPLALATLFLMHSLWRLGQSIEPGRAAVAALAFAAGFGVKFSALLFLPLAALTLVCRALLPAPWPFFGRPLAGRGARLLASAILLVVFVGTAWGAIWASYRFRYAPSGDPEVRLDTGEILDRMRRANLEIARFAQGGEPASDEDAIPEWQPGRFLRCVLWAERHRVLPQAWLYGIVYSEGGLMRREGYLLGELRLDGWWYYMPLAGLFKTPLATLLAAFAAAVAGVLALRRRHASRDPSEASWSAVCQVLPIVVFGTALMASRVSIGLRHALMIYPFVFIAVGVAAAGARVVYRRSVQAVLAVLLAALTIETLAAYPDFIPFFNAACRPGRMTLLGDSNLDWGQDLKLLAGWQRRNPGRPLYLAYFGQADPASYGIVCRRLPTASLGEPGTEMPAPGDRVVLAVSATHLQQIYIRDRQLISFYRSLRRQRPLEVLGGTIYLFDATRGQPGG
jgi:hypothetical protein